MVIHQSAVVVPFVLLVKAFVELALIVEFDSLSMFSVLIIPKTFVFFFHLILQIDSWFLLNLNAVIFGSSHIVVPWSKCFSFPGGDFITRFVNALLLPVEVSLNCVTSKNSFFCLRCSFFFGILLCLRFHFLS